MIAEATSRLPSSAKSLRSIVVIVPVIATPALGGTDGASSRRMTVAAAYQATAVRRRDERSMMSTRRDDQPVRASRQLRAQVNERERADSASEDKGAWQHCPGRHVNDGTMGSAQLVSRPLAQYELHRAKR